MQYILRFLKYRGFYGKVILTNMNSLEKSVLVPKLSCRYTKTQYTVK